MPSDDREPSAEEKTVEQLLRESRELRERAQRLEQIAEALGQQIAERDRFRYVPPKDEQQ